MKAEYKRDLSHNYLILEGENIDTACYQTRMLISNAIPSLLKCRIQGIDGKFAVYYDITSRQSLIALYEKEKYRIGDLQLIFGGIIKMLEEMTEYLVDASWIVLDPAYIYLDAEKKTVSFCCMPGYDRDVCLQLQKLVEYMLPGLDHEDEQAVELGYNLYRKTLEDGLLLEQLKKELFRMREKTAETKTIPPVKENGPCVVEKPEENVHGPYEAGDPFDTDGPFRGNMYDKKDKEKRQKKKERTEEKKKQGKKQRKKQRGYTFWYAAGSMAAGAVMLLVLSAGACTGWIPVRTAEKLWLIIVMGTAGILLGIWLFHKASAGDQKQVLPEPVCPENMPGSAYGRTANEPEKREVRREELQEVQKEKHQIEQPGNWQEEHKGKQWEERHTCTETVVLSAKSVNVPSALVSYEPGELATIYLKEELTLIGKLETAVDAVIDLPTVSRMHARIRKRDGEYYLSDLNSKNGTSVNGRMLRAEEEYWLQNEDQVDFAQARYIFLK